MSGINETSPGPVMRPPSLGRGFRAQPPPPPSTSTSYMVDIPQGGEKSIAVRVAKCSCCLAMHGLYAYQLQRMWAEHIDASPRCHDYLHKLEMLQRKKEKVLCMINSRERRLANGLPGNRSSLEDMYENYEDLHARVMRLEAFINNQSFAYQAWATLPGPELLDL